MIENGVDWHESRNQGVLFVEHKPVQRYQMHLKQEAGLETLLDSMVRSIFRFFSAYPYPGWKEPSQKEVNRLNRVLRKVLSYYVSSYDSCGRKRVCFEYMEPVSWNIESNSSFKKNSERGTQILQLEVRDGIDEFCKVLELATFKVVLRNWSGSKIAEEDIRIGIRGTIKATFGPILFKRLDKRCDTCSVGHHISPWRWPLVKLKQKGEIG